MKQIQMQMAPTALFEEPEMEISLVRGIRYQVTEGINYFGSDPGNDIVLPGDHARFAGILILENDRVLIRVAVGQKIMHNNRPADNSYIYEPGVSRVLSYGTLKFRIVQRHGSHSLLILE